MITRMLSKIFGTRNDREIKKLQPLVQKINDLEAEIEALSDSELAQKTNIFREQIQRGASLDSILPEAFAVVREAGKRTLHMRHYDVQLMGGIALHNGKIAEMKTGEGKTLVATLPLYLNGLSGKGAHLITVNDYLASRDAEWNRPLYNFLSLEVGCIQNSMSDSDRKKAYLSDITYGTNNEFGFDYLRDNMKFDLEEYAQQELNFVIVDEVDSILIDEARTPLIISGASDRSSDLYKTANSAVKGLTRDTDYEVDEKAHSVNLTEEGTDKVERALSIKNLYSPDHINHVHHVQQALKANSLFRRDVEYVVRDNKISIVDEFTGRILPGRRYSDGLHQALEAKENVKIERENQTLASITLKNYFMLYNRLSGMTGTAQTEAAEFHKIYKLDVLSIPTHRPLVRRDESDVIYLSKEDKFQGVIEDIKDCHARNQPCLVGTIAIETSELMSNLLDKEGIPHNVLNAKNHSREAEIIIEAGQLGRVTIATNMAGRGTDIKLAKGVLEAGGLRIIGTERHESRRIDNQLRGRSGRQGDPGSSKFYISLEDDLIRIFSGGDQLKRRMEFLGMEKGENIEHPRISKNIESAQEKVEKRNFDIRKHLIEYDDVMNNQRNIIYQFRREILEGKESIKNLMKDLITDIIITISLEFFQEGNCTAEQKNSIFESLVKVCKIEASEMDHINIIGLSPAEVQNNLVDFFLLRYEGHRNKLNQELVDEAEKWLLLESVDHTWKRHLQNIDHLKEGIGLRGYGQKNPLVEYKRESFAEFEQMMYNVKYKVVKNFFRTSHESISAASINEISQEKERELAAIKMGGMSDKPERQTAKREAPKVGRNDPCACGSGKKYKHCCA